MTKELIEGTPKGGCGEGLCAACAAHDFTPSLGAVREAQRGLANEHISGDEIVAAFDRMIEKLVADALAAWSINEGETK